MLDVLPSDALGLVLETMSDLPTLRNVRACCRQLASASRRAVRSDAFKQIPANLAALRVACWAEQPPVPHVLVASETLMRTICAVAVEGNIVASVDNGVHDRNQRRHRNLADPVAEEEQ